MATKITFKASELRRLLANAMLFAAPEKDCLPALSAVRFDWDKDHLFAVATNRYVLSWEESWPVEAKGREPFSVSTRDAKRVLAMIPKQAGPADEVIVEYDPDGNVALFEFDGDTVKVRTGIGDFPNWRSLAEKHESGMRDSITFGPQWLALLAKVQCDAKEQPIHFDLPEGNKPAKITMGEHFKALVVPMRLAA